jgi:hypothetical protein
LGLGRSFAFSLKISKWASKSDPISILFKLVNISMITAYEEKETIKAGDIIETN